ncbi:unnamed protein product [Lymnaea stagnalis]|uniref:Methyltransferase domain-containing protein n=1 Tax=Lymnaea stagnalis TaxID=6523 RepID=A0AAV2HGE4_LYMST
MKTKLYLEGLLSGDGTLLHCSLSSSTIIFMLRYCQTNNFELIFISENRVRNCCSLNLKLLEDLDVIFSSLSEVPSLVRNVLMPAIYQPELSLIRSGLCVLLRHIIKFSDTASPHLHLIDLLGFREGSMKMCSEISGWTKLCEVELLESIAELIENLQVNKSVKKVFTVPSDLIKLEYHFLKKCRVHNDDKMRRTELIRLKTSFSNYFEGGTLVNRDNDKLNRANSVTDQTNGITLNPLQSTNGGYSHQPDSHAQHFTTSPRISFEKILVENSRLLVEQIVHMHHGVRKVKVDKIIDKDKNLKDGNSIKETEGALKSFSSIEDTLFNKETGKATEMDISELIQQLHVKDIQYVHTYSEGIEMTVADLILIVYLYHLLETLDFNYVTLNGHIPSIMQWACHMASLTTVADAGHKMGWRMRSLATLFTTVRSSSACISSDGHHMDVTFVKGVEPAAGDDDDDEMELSRCAKMKHKAVKPEVIQAVKKLENANVQAVKGEHPCGEQVQIDWSSLPPDVHPREGDVPEKRTKRKCQQIENLVTAVQSVAKSGDVLVDFCSGGGHLGIVLAYMLPDCQVFLVENKEESLLKSCNRLKSLNLRNVILYQCNLDYFTGQFDVGTCLHACGSATDMILQLCLNSFASFVICPCCYGSIQKTHLLSYPRSQVFIKANLTYKEFLTLGHAADQTELNIVMEDQGHQCMNLVDTDRAEYAKEMNYNVTLCALHPLSCTPKNNLLVGTRNVPVLQKK